MVCLACNIAATARRLLLHDTARATASHISDSHMHERENGRSASANLHSAEVAFRPLPLRHVTVYSAGCKKVSTYSAQLDLRCSRQAGGHVASPRSATQKARQRSRSRASVHVRSFRTELVKKANIGAFQVPCLAWAQAKLVNTSGNSWMIGTGVFTTAMRDTCANHGRAFCHASPGQYEGYRDPCGDSVKIIGHHRPGSRCSSSVSCSCPP